MSDEYVKRKDVLAMFSQSRTISQAMDGFMRLPPADVVEVVRCKDCKHGEVDNADFPNQYFCNHHGCDWNEGEHFCSYGERKDNE